MRLTMGRPTKASAAAGCSGDRLNMCSYNGNIYRRFVVRVWAVVEFTSVAGDVTSAGDLMPEFRGTRVRKGTLNSYPVASMMESTESRELPSSKKTVDEVKCVIGGLTVTCAPSGGELPSLRDW